MTRFRPPTDAERHALRRKLDLRDDAVACVFLGRLIGEKCLDLMEAWSGLRPSRTVLVVAGSDMTAFADLVKSLSGARA